MPDIDALLRRLQGPPPPPRAPRIPGRSFPWRPVLAMAAGVAVAIGGISLLPEPEVLTRGGEDTAPAGVFLDLRMVVERNGQAYRVSRHAPCRVGERLFFRIAADRQVPVVLLVEGPGGREEVARAVASPSATDVRSGSGLAAYVFDRPGTYTFVLTTDPSRACTPGNCTREILEVQ